MKRLSDVLAGKGENYILPFFWQHGETEETLREYMNAIHNCGIGAVCCECRPHPDFCGPQWWHDMDIILDEAKKLDMKVWILDDSHFPTGQANGKMRQAPDELCKQYLDFNEVEISGPTPAVTLNIAQLSHPTPSPMASGIPFMTPDPNPRTFDDDTLVAVLAARADGNAFDGGTLTDLTDRVQNGSLIWDVPDGWWRVFVVFKTRNGGGNKHYINVCSPASVRVQIDAVYEPHYARYKDEFGKTIMGFFSDEPQLGNIAGFAADNWIGKKMPLPWSEDVEADLRARWGASYSTQLPRLWFPDSDDAAMASARYQYMDAVTLAVERAFSMQLGDWCAAHGVSYIGHTIEDNNQHARLGQSFGHHFRGLGGQHMGGIDNIGGQVLLSAGRVLRNGGIMGADQTNDGEFFHFMLGKLGSSNGILDPRKHGDSMCEIFGAYGWSEGTRLMKFLTDHFLVRGVNHYVPHAFSPGPFPDYDCPPHYYAHGLNPLYQGFGQLMRYMNRVCHLLSGGQHRAPAAVLYHGEAEWSSREAGYMLSQQPLRVLAEHQMDSDILWLDVLTQRERFGTVVGKTLRAGCAEFRVLIIPYSYYIPEALADFLTDAEAAGFPVIFAGGHPAALADKPGAPLPESVLRVPVVSLDDLPTAVAPYADVTASPSFPDLRCYHYAQESDLYMLSNESTGETFSGQVTLEGEGVPVLYDAMENVLHPAVWDGHALTLTLEPYQSVLVVFDHKGDTVPEVRAAGEKTVLTGPWKVSFKDALNQDAGYRNDTTVTSLENLARLAPNFSGWVRYETAFTAPASKQAVLQFEDAYETVSVAVNGKSAGTAICPPYRFDLSALLQPGENTLTVEVATTLERAVAALPPREGDPEAVMQRPMNIGYPFGLIGEAALWSM